MQDPEFISMQMLQTEYILHSWKCAPDIDE